MADAHDNSQDIARVKVLLAARLAVISFYMGLVVFFQEKYEPFTASFPTLAPVAAAYALSIIYALLLRHISNLKVFILIQLSLDLILVTSIIYLTGGVNSPFSFMYIFVIFAGSVLLKQSAIYSIASAAAVLYGIGLNLEYYEFIQPHYIFPPAHSSKIAGYVFMQAVINIAAFYLVAFLSGSASLIISKKELQLEKQSEDFTLLKAFHENVLENMGSGVLAVDLEGKILSHNPAIENILGLSFNDLSQKKITEALNLVRLEKFFSNLANLKSHTPQFNWVNKRKDGKEISLTMTVSKYLVEGDIKGAIVVLHDVTYIKNMEKQVAESERLAAIGRVAAGIAHEIRNPLGSLSGSIQLLSQDGDLKISGSNRRLMDIVMRETNRLNKIITQFLDYASPPKLKLDKTDMGAILSETVSLIKVNPEYNEKLIIEENIDKGILADVDQDKIRQIIWNLLQNALDACHDGGVIRVRLTKDALTFDRRKNPNTGSNDSRLMPKDHVRITISDTGSGIEPDNLNKIFEPFFTTKRKGAGLGLPMVYKIVESHNGNISVDSEPGKGATFDIRLPIKGINENK